MNYYMRDEMQFAQNADLTELVKGLFAAMADGRKIDAIKAYRALTGEGLKPSKDAIESVACKVPAPMPHWDNGYEFGYYVLTRSPNTELNEFCDAWRCNEGSSTLNYARSRANDAVDAIADGETVFIMKVVARSTTTTTMKDM